MQTRISFVITAKVLEAKRGGSPRTGGMGLWTFLFTFHEIAPAGWFVSYLGKFWICTGDDQGLSMSLVEDASSLRNIGPQDATYTARPASWLRHFPWSNASHRPLGEISASRFESQIIHRH